MAISDLDNQIVIPAIAYAEAQHQYERGGFQFPAATYLAQLRSQREVLLAVLDEAVLRLKPGGLEIHDSLIVATALKLEQALPEEKIRVVTCDEAITASGLVRTLW